MIRTNSTFNIQSFYCNVHSEETSFPYAMEFLLPCCPQNAEYRTTHRKEPANNSQNSIFLHSESRMFKWPNFHISLFWCSDIPGRPLSFSESHNFFERTAAALWHSSVLAQFCYVTQSFLLIDFWFGALACVRTHTRCCACFNHAFLDGCMSTECSYFSHTLPMKVYAPLRLPSTRCPIVFQLFVWMWIDYLTAHLLYYLHDKHLYVCGSSHLYCCGDLKRCCKYHNIRQGSISCFPFNETLHRK